MRSKRLVESAQWCVSLHTAGLFLGLTLAGAQSLTHTAEHLGSFAPVDVNDARQVLTSQGAVWKDGALMPLQTLGARARPRRWSAIDDGTSVGSITYVSTGFEGAATWDASGALTLLAQHPDEGSVATGQNRQGVSAGVHGRFDAAYGGPVQSAARWNEPTSLTVLDTQDGQWSDGEGIDEKGYTWGIDGTGQAVTWDKAGTKVPIPKQPAPFTSFVTVAGLKGFGHASDTAGFSVPVEATRTAGFVVLPQLEGGQCSIVDGNQAGSAAGNCVMADGSIVMVLWQQKKIKRVTTDIPPEVLNVQLTGLSDSGLLVARGSVRSTDPVTGMPITVTHAYLLTPALKKISKR